MIYEMCINLWDKWENEGPKHSSISELYPLKRIRLALIFNDSDASNDTYVQWRNLAGNNWWRNAEEIPTFVLDPPSKTDISLQGIRYVLSP